MPIITGQVLGAELIVTGFRDLSNSVLKQAFAGVVDALEMAHEDAHKIISADDHSLRDLAKMGHPYSAEHGMAIHDPDETVHTQTGDYLAALTVEKPASYADRDIVEGSVHIGDEQAQLDREIQLGTSKMRARPWMQRILDDHGDEYVAAVESRVEAALRSEGVA